MSKGKKGGKDRPRNLGTEWNLYILPRTQVSSTRIFQWNELCGGMRLWELTEQDLRLEVVKLNGELKIKISARHWRIIHHFCSVFQGGYWGLTRQPSWISAILPNEPLVTPRMRLLLKVHYLLYSIPSKYPATHPYHFFMNLTSIWVPGSFYLSSHVLLCGNSRISN
jgi:hypothetical protein